jgi:uncharacterized protein (DUF58 family)
MLVFIIIVIVSMLINQMILRFGYNDLHYKMNIEKKFVEIDEAIAITTVVENRKLLALPLLTVREFFPLGFEESKNVHNMYILPKQRVSRKYATSCSRRGKKYIESVELELGDFFGFKAKKAFLNLEEYVIVKPKKVDLEEKLTLVGALSGEIPVKRHLIDDPLMTIGIREYSGSEPQRFIHWPSSIRYGELMVKQFDFTSENNVMVLLNCEAKKPSWEPIEEDLIEKTISYCRGVVETLEESKIPYGLMTNAKDKRNIVEEVTEIRTAMGKSHFEATLEKISVLEYRLVNFFENTLVKLQSNQNRFKTLVIITPRLLETYIEPLNVLSKITSKLIVISLESQGFEKLDKRIITYKERL